MLRNIFASAVALGIPLNVNFHVFAFHIRILRLFPVQIRAFVWADALIILTRRTQIQEKHNPRTHFERCIILKSA